MGWVFWATVGVFAVFVGALIVVATTPLIADLMVSTTPQPRWRIALYVLGGRIGMPVMESDPSEAEKPDLEKPASDLKRQPKPKQKSSVGRAQRAAGASVRMIMQVLRRISVLEASVEGTFGLPDPADTGAVYGVLTPLIFATPRSSRARWAIEPDFHNAGFSGTAALRLRLRPVALVSPLTAFVWRVFGPVR